MNIIRAHGWRRDLPDKRDLMFEHAAPHATLPAHMDLMVKCPPVYDQLQLGSCTANAMGGCHEFDLLKQGIPGFRPSRLFLYYATRAYEGTTAYDAGGTIRDSAKAVSHLGVPDERLWPYDIGRFTVRPPKSVYRAAINHRAIQYERVPQTHDDLRRVLASGLPIAFGFSVYDSFESDAVAATGLVPMPEDRESMVGGHAVMLVGYDDLTKRYYVRNSWGTGWGLRGYCTMPYAYVEDPQLAGDFWCIREII